MVRRTANGSCEQMCDASLQNLVGRQPDRVQEALGFEVFVHLRRGEGGVAPEIQSYLPTLVRWSHFVGQFGGEVKVYSSV